MSNKLLSPANLAGLTLNNRMVMAPMTRNRAPEGIANAIMAEYYRQRAGAGLIVTEGSQISAQAVGYPATPGIYTAEQVAGWRQVCDAVHAEGGHIFVQLWHCGRISHPDFHAGELPVAPSAIRPAGDAFTYEGLKPFVTPRALDTSEIPAIVAQYRHAATCAKDAGFDGVEIHAANGYLIDQFIRDGSNKRTDRYGGSLENRTRLLVEIVNTVGSEIGFNRVGVRISPVNGFNDMSDTNPQATFNHVATSLSGLGLAYLHVVEVSMTGEASSEFDCRQLRDCFDGAYIANGGFDQTRAEDTLHSDSADLIAFGVPFLANPDLPERFRRNAPLNEADQTTFYGGDEHGYTDYPILEND
ncbi:N-ethylmaleimide reductase [Mariprofundus ferrinatatus]|uniref:N-ethylmaleimide reductase n=1 Tax=Mariprofundus ferrinatatus TaxID=1921087 RepID=A0A2K8L5L8_9PROT|nr:alkene reductase [Mariprofundus ferrinatatus]ATX82608.1 N-ethylmaleimide reductase [Mariprofundus ferrinatatus]